MKVLAVNATGRPKKTTTALAQKALDGAASMGAETEMVLLAELDINFCTNCLTCYQDLESEIAQCSIEDDVRSVLGKIRDADGVIFASPLHSGFVTALMAAFMERATWTTCRPTAEILGVKGAPEPRLAGKGRAVATIINGGLIPQELRQYCDAATPWLADQGALICNGSIVGDLYAGAFFPRELKGDEWSRAYFIRELTQAQMQQAYDLGVKMAGDIQSGNVKPYDPMANLPEPPA